MVRARAASHTTQTPLKAVKDPTTAGHLRTKALAVVVVVVAGEVKAILDTSKDKEIPHKEDRGREAEDHVHATRTQNVEVKGEQEGHNYKDKDKDKDRISHQMPFPVRS